MCRSSHRLRLSPFCRQTKRRCPNTAYEKACAADPEPGFLHAYLAAAYALYGDNARAAAELAEARRRGFSSLSRMQSVTDFGVPEVRALFEVTYFAGLRLAGMPE
jgi:hypothetical protein